MLKVLSSSNRNKKKEKPSHASTISYATAVIAKLTSTSYKLLQVHKDLNLMQNTTGVVPSWAANFILIPPLSCAGTSIHMNTSHKTKPTEKEEQSRKMCLYTLYGESLCANKNLK